MSREQDLKKWSSYFKVLGNPVRFAIVLLLYGSEIIRGTRSLRFTEISNVLSIPTSSTSVLTHYLNQLIKAGFVIKENGEKRNPLYHIGSDGKAFLEELGLTEILRTRIEKLLSKSP